MGQISTGLAVNSNRCRSPQLKPSPTISSKSRNMVFHRLPKSNRKTLSSLLAPASRKRPTSLPPRQMTQHLLLPLHPHHPHHLYHLRTMLIRVIRCITSTASRLPTDTRAHTSMAHLDLDHIATARSTTFSSSRRSPQLTGTSSPSRPLRLRLHLQQSQSRASRSKTSWPC